MTESVYGGALIERVISQHNVLESIRCDCLTEMRRIADRDPEISQAARIQLLNCANAIVNAQMMLSRLQTILEEEVE